MKKNTSQKIIYQLRIARDRYKRKARGLQKKKAHPKAPVSRGGGSTFLRIEAPAHIDLYKPGNFLPTIDFLNNLRNAYGVQRSSVVICFRNTISITAAAGLLLIAEVDKLVKLYGNSTLTCNRPNPVRKKYGALNNTVECVLNQIGFFKLIGMRERVLNAPHNVTCWDYSSGEVTESQMAGELLKKIENLVSKEVSAALYKGAIEAMANSVEHGYIEERNDGTGYTDKRWWMFASVMSGQLVIIVCDLGVGIPNTLHKTQPPSLLQAIMDKWKIVEKGDAAWIKAATLVKETRTEHGHRGKGGTDLRSLLQVSKGAKLSIFSNKGYYELKNLMTKNGMNKAFDFAVENRESIKGTIVQWSVPVGSIQE